jgi:hypothetical protein
MSYEGPSSELIDTSHPYLIPRGNDEIHVWEVQTREDGSLYIDEETGWPYASGLHAEEIGGEVGIPYKPVSPKLLGDEIQSRLAEELAHSRPSAKPEDFERITHTVETGTEQERALKDALRESLELVGSIDTAVSDELQRSRMIDSRIGEIAQQWKHIAYGGRADPMQVEQMIAEVYQVRGLLSDGIGANDDLRRKTDKLVEDLDDTKRKTISHIQEYPDADEALPGAVKRAMDEAEELASQIKNASYRDETINDELNRLALNMNNLLQDKYGWEVYMSQIKQILDQFESDTMYTRGVPYMRAEGSVDGLRRIRANVEE